MGHKTKLGLSAAGLLLTLWSASTVAAGSTSDVVRSFESLGLHIEIDLPAVGGERRRTDARSILDLPAEIALEAKASVGLARLELFDPLGVSTIVIDSPTSHSFGLSELSYEGAAQTLRELLREFTPGVYRVTGRTLDGARLEGHAFLDVEFPGPFSVVAPAPMQPVAENGVVIEWTPSANAVEYRLEVENDAAGFSFEQVLSASRTSMVLPAGLFEAGEEYEYSLTVKGDTDNELEIEGSFRVLR